MSSLWPPREAAQVEYESLRDQVLRGQVLDPQRLRRFQQTGLAGLVTPSTTAVLTWEATLIGATRPPWTPRQDPRLEALTATFEWLLHNRLSGSAVHVLEGMR